MIFLAASAACGPVEEETTTNTSAICSVSAWPVDAVAFGEPDGLVYYKFTGDAPESHKTLLRTIMAEWATRTGVVRFIESETNPRSRAINVDDDVNVDSACMATNIPPRCANAARHELAHRLGLAHEQHRFDRDRYITVNPSSLQCNDGSVGNRYVDNVWSGTNYGPYNKRSILHYNPSNRVDGVFNFTNKNGTTNGLGSMGTITNGDINMVREHQARHAGWARFRSWGTDVGNQLPLEPTINAQVDLNTSRPVAAARIRRTDIVLAFGDDNRVYMRSEGTSSSGWRLRWSDATAIAATTMGDGGELALGRMTATGLFVDVSNNADISAKNDEAGDDAFLNTLVFPSTWNFGTPPGTGTITSIDLTSFSSQHMAAIARRANGDVWMRTTNLTQSFEGGWRLVASGTQPVAPRIVAFNDELHILYARFVSVGAASLMDQVCWVTHCGPFVRHLRPLPLNTSFAVSASETDFHLIYRDAGGNLEWNQFGEGSSTTLIGGPGVGLPVTTNRFEDRYGGFGLFARLSDGNLWRKEYNRYLPGRLGQRVVNDYDHDGKTDPVVVRNGKWWIWPSAGFNITTFQWGVASDTFLPSANFGGNWPNDLMVYRQGSWYGRNIKRTSSNDNGRVDTLESSPHTTVGFGGPGDIPVPGDYDGDGVVDKAVFRPSNGRWYARPSGGGPDIVAHWGVSTDRPVPGDYDGDGRTDHAVFRPSNGTWHVRPSSGAPAFVIQYGRRSDKLVHGDWDGDGRTDIAVYRPSKGTWYIRMMSGDRKSIRLGTSSDRLAPGDYDGDGRLDAAVVPSNNVWRIRPSGGGSDFTRYFGVSTDVLPWPATTR